MNYILAEGIIGTEGQEIAKEIASNPSIIQKYLDKYLPILASKLMHLIIAILVLIIGVQIIKRFSKFIQKTLDKSNIDTGVVSFLTSLIKYALYVVLVMAILNYFGIGTGSVVAILGSAGLAVGLALQGSLSNFAGGVLILIIKPFVVGDYIIVSGSGVEGTVTDITLFYTKLTTVDNKMISVPNGGLADANITNVTAMDKRRVDVYVGVSYKTDLALAKDVLTKTANAQEYILKDEPLNVFVSELKDSSVELGVRMWVKSENYWDAKWSLTEDIKNNLDKNDIEIPFPQIDVHLDK